MNGGKPVNPSTYAKRNIVITRDTTVRVGVFWVVSGRKGHVQGTWILLLSNILVSANKIVCLPQNGSLIYSSVTSVSSLGFFENGW